MLTTASSAKIFDDKADTLPPDLKL